MTTKQVILKLKSLDPDEVCEFVFQDMFQNGDGVGYLDEFPIMDRDITKVPSVDGEKEVIRINRD